MSAILQFSPKYNMNSHLELDDTGNIILVQDQTAYEILTRLNSLRATYFHDIKFGSELPKILNSKGGTANINNTKITQWVRDALSPMITQGKIKSKMKVIPFITNTLVKIDITCYNIEGKPITSIFKSFLYN